MNVDMLILHRFMKLNIRRALLGTDPENRIPADISKFPAGLFLTNGWLNHSLMYGQDLHLCLIFTMEPFT